MTTDTFDLLITVVPWVLTVIGFGLVLWKHYGVSIIVKRAVKSAVNEKTNELMHTLLLEKRNVDMLALSGYVKFLQKGDVLNRVKLICNFSMHLDDLCKYYLDDPTYVQSLMAEVASEKKSHSELVQEVLCKCGEIAQVITSKNIEEGLYEPIT